MFLTGLPNKINLLVTSKAHKLYNQSIDIRKTKGQENKKNTQEDLLLAFAFAFCFLLNHNVKLSFTRQSKRTAFDNFSSLQNFILSFLLSDFERHPIVCLFLLFRFNDLFLRHYFGFGFSKYDKAPLTRLCLCHHQSLNNCPYTIQFPQHEFAYDVDLSSHV